MSMYVIACVFKGVRSFGTWKHPVCRTCMRCMCGSGACDRCREERLMNENGPFGLVPHVKHNRVGPYLTPQYKTVRHKSIYEGILSHIRV